MKNYNAGQLRDKCKILEVRTECDESGFAKKTYVVKYSLKCFTAPMVTKECLGTDNNISKVQTTVTIRKKENITTKDYISIDEDIFNIINITKELSSQYMELTVEKRE